MGAWKLCKLFVRVRFSPSPPSFDARVAQWESTRLISDRSTVQSCPRVPDLMPGKFKWQKHCLDKAETIGSNPIPGTRFYRSQALMGLSYSGIIPGSYPENLSSILSDPTKFICKNAE